MNSSLPCPYLPLPHRSSLTTRITVALALIHFSISAFFLVRGLILTFLVSLFHYKNEWATSARVYCRHLFF